MNDQDLAAIIDRANATVHQSQSQARAYHESIGKRMSQTRYDEAQSYAGLVNVEIMNVLVAQITLQVATLGVLNDIKAALQKA